MNVERLLSVLDALLASAKRTGLEAKVSETVAAIQAVVTEPGNASYPQQLAEKLTSLAEVAREDTLEKYPVMAREIIGEFALENLVAADVEQRVRTLVQANAATPSVALSAVTTLRDETTADLAALRQIQSGLQRFHLHPDKIGADRAGISFIIPRVDQSEPPRVCRRLPFLRRWSDEQAAEKTELFAGGS